MHPVAAMLMLLAAPVAPGYTAEELAAKNVEARGSIDKVQFDKAARGVQMPTNLKLWN